MTHPRGNTERSDLMSVDDANIAVIATEVRLMKDDLGRRIDELKTEQRESRADIAANFVHNHAYQAEYGRMSDRVERAEATIIEMRTSLAAQFVDVHGHIERRFEEIAEQVKERFEEITEQCKARFDEITESRRFKIGQGVLIGTALLAAATAIVIALIGAHP